MSELKIPLLFEKNEYIIDQRANLLKIGNTYDIVDTEGKKIGIIDQQIPAWHKLLLLVLDKQAFPYTYHFKDEKGNIGATVKRGWTYFMSKIQILDANNNVIGVIKEKFNLMAHNTLLLKIIMVT
ncbi:hypothetical protein [Flavobacterium sp.]|uniref:hypothetical protein n=1 Tax=Flavobacterium sp. TaxID=239 RepID=UPI003D105471